MKQTFCIILFFLSSLSFGQRFDSMLSKADKLVSESHDSAAYYVNQLDQIISKEDTGRYYEVLILKSKLLRKDGENDNAISLLIEAKQLAKTQEQEARVCVELGTHFLIKNDYKEGLKNLTCALNYYEEEKATSKNNKILLRCYGNLGLLKKENGEYEEALEYFQKAVVLSSPKERTHFSIRTDIADIYSDLGQYHKAIDYSETLKKELEAKDYPLLLSWVYRNLGSNYRKLNQLDQAVFYGKKAVKLTEEAELSSTTSKNDLALSLMTQNKHQKALGILLSIDGEKGESVLTNTRECYRKLGKTDKALEYALKHISYKDSIHRKNTETRLAEVLTAYETEKKQHEIDHLNNENRLKEKELKTQKILWLTSVFGLLLLGMLAYVGYRFQKQREDLQKATIQNKLLHSQLNPHFLFHSLQNIQSFIYQNEKEKSVKYLNNYSQLIRSVFDTSDEDFITIEQDSETIKNYITLQKLNHDHSFDVDFHVDESILEYSIPPLIVQPYVENAIIHGLNDDKTGVITVRYEDKGNQVAVIIQDYGNKDKKGSQSLKLKRYSSTKVIKKRVEQLAKGHKFNLIIEKEKYIELFTVSITFDKIIKV